MKIVHLSNGASALSVQLEDGDATVGQLKQRLNSQFGLPADMIVLKRGYTVLRDNDTIEPSQRLSYSVNLRGGCGAGLNTPCGGCGCRCSIQ